MINVNRSDNIRSNRISTNYYGSYGGVTWKRNLI